MTESTTMASPQLLAGGDPQFLTKAYYRLKPFIPASLRWAARRHRARRQIKSCQDTWPINEAAAAPPEDWDGWPDGKRFGLVITHDVESSEGVRKVRPLAKMVRAHGFRSSFNFIPENVYPDPVDLRRWLQHIGFEVGVHDLKHDGRLYNSRNGFRRKAKRINNYLEDWGAVGFRSGFMVRCLDWLHDLDLSYDTSTFDTDPFEPVPSGSRTIFPFMVKADGDGPDSGYVELPYTLPQDSTLFLLLGEQTIDIWKRKVDWIAMHGGLALVNIHPDFIDFSGKRDVGSSYASRLVSEFLDYLNTRYSGQYWNPVPREMAAWFKQGRNLDAGSPGTS